MDLPIGRTASEITARNIVDVFDALASRSRHNAYALKCFDLAPKA